MRMNRICRLLQNSRPEAGLFRDSSRPLPGGRPSFSRRSPVLPIRLIRPIGPILPFGLL